MKPSWTIALAGAVAVLAPAPEVLAQDIVFVGAGDIGRCDSDADDATAGLLDRLARQYPDMVVFTAGDNAYSDGTPREFRDCFGSSWGRHLARIRPAPGNHDYRDRGSLSDEEMGAGASGGGTSGGYESGRVTEQRGSRNDDDDDGEDEDAYEDEDDENEDRDQGRRSRGGRSEYSGGYRGAASGGSVVGARGYFDYFGAAAGDPGAPWYSYDLGAWHIVVLNSEVTMRAGSAQERWLRQDLAASTNRCTIAIWHQPRFSSGRHGNNTATTALWEALYDAGAEIVINGHDHDYERFAPQTPSGSADPDQGIRQFVVGTGGANLRPFEGTMRNSEVRNSSTHGVLKLTLRSGSYRWEFVPARGGFRDSGEGTCH